MIDPVLISTVVGALLIIALTLWMTRPKKGRK